MIKTTPHQKWVLEGLILLADQKLLDRDTFAKQCRINERMRDWKKAEPPKEDQDG